MGEVGALVEAWRDRRDPRPSDAWIGEKVGVKSRSSVGPWLRGESMPGAAHLRELASLIGVNYATVLTAALLDAGYLEEREAHDFRAAAIALSPPGRITSTTRRRPASPRKEPTPPPPGGPDAAGLP